MIPDDDNPVASGNATPGWGWCLGAFLGSFITPLSSSDTRSGFISVLERFACCSAGEESGTMRVRKGHVVCLDSSVSVAYRLTI